MFHAYDLFRSWRKSLIVLLGSLGLTVTLLCLTACNSKEMTRSRAADLIEASEEFKNPVTVTLRPDYRQSLTLAGASSQTTPKEEFALRRFLESHPDLAVLAHLGLVEFKIGRIEYPNSASSPVTVTASLTSEGRSTSREWLQSGDRWAIPIARRELIEMTGLTGGDGDSKTARAEYTWRLKPLGVGMNFDTSSPEYQSLPESIRRNLAGISFADALAGAGQVTFFDGSKSQKGVVTLRLYDDGWRIAK